MEERETVSLELLQLTFGAIAARIVREAEGVDSANAQLRALGASMGGRLADDFFASRAAAVLSRAAAEAPGSARVEAALPRCSTFRDAMQSLASYALPQYLGVAGAVGRWGEGDGSVELELERDVLSEFMEVPAALEGLQPASFLCGAIEGALKAVRFTVVASVVADAAQGAPKTTLSIFHKETVAATAGEEYEED